MRQVVYLVAASVDGAIATAGGSFDCFPMEGDHIGAYLEMLGGFDDVLMGRKTYEVGLRAGVTNPYPALRTHVFSRSMKESPDPNVILVRSDPAAYAARLRAEPGRDIYLCGGGELASVLLENGVVDQLIVKLNPLLIGRGIPLFREVACPLPLRYAGLREFSSGVVFLTYAVAN